MEQLRKRPLSAAKSVPQLAQGFVPSDPDDSKRVYTRYNQVYGDIAADFGGDSQLTNTQRYLCRTTAEILVRAQDIAAQYAERPMLAEARDHVLVVNALCRCFNLLGVTVRKNRPDPAMVPDLEDYVEAAHVREDDELAEAAE